MPPSFSKWYASYLTNRVFQVQIAQATSDNFNIHSGIPQGVLSPCPFNILIETLSCPNLDLFLFADDITTLYDHNKISTIPFSDQVVMNINEVVQALTVIKLQINTKKTQILISTSCNNFITPTIQDVTVVQSIHILGFSIDSNCKWN